MAGPSPDVSFLIAGYTIAAIQNMLPSLNPKECTNQMMTNDKLATGSKDVPRQSYNMPAAFGLAAVVFACFSHGTSQAQTHPQEQKTKVIYFLSGIRDHASPTV